MKHVNKQFGTALLLLAGALATAPAAADTRIAGAVGATGQSDMTWRASLSHDWDRRWWEGDSGYLSGYWDAAYTYWEGGDEAAGAHSLSFSPVLVYQFHGQRLRPFVEFGIGVALFSKTDVGNRNLGSSFNFEDRLGAGVILPSGSRLGVRAIHYSNAGIKQPNDGIESYALFYSRAF